MVFDTFFIECLHVRYSQIEDGNMVRSDDVLRPRAAVRCARWGSAQVTSGPRPRGGGPAGIGIGTTRPEGYLCDERGREVPLSGHSVRHR